MTKIINRKDIKSINNFKTIEGNIPVVLSAPHAVPQMRNWKKKGRDLYTGQILEYLCKKTGAFGIVRTKNLYDDPNFYKFGLSLRYKKKLMNIIHDNGIKCCIDLHGCKDGYSFDFDIGINGGKNICQREDLLKIIVDGLGNLGKVAVDGRFKAGKSSIISMYISEKMNIPCFQIEVNLSNRENHEFLFKMVEIINEINQKL